MSVLPNPAPRRLLRSRLTKSCSNSDWIGTASSSSRRQAPSPNCEIAKDHMPYLAPIGTDLGCWGSPRHWVAGDDDDASTRAGEPGGPHTPPTSTSLKLTFPSRALTETAMKVLALPSGSGATSLS